jgi:hypothetical protein
MHRRVDRRKLFANGYLVSGPDVDEGEDAKAGIPTVPMAKLRGGLPIHALAKKNYQGSNQVYKPSF